MHYFCSAVTPCGFKTNDYNSNEWKNEFIFIYFL